MSRSSVAFNQARENKTYRNSLQALKEKGDLFPFSSITEEQLIHLWFVELIPVSSIAHLFNVTDKEVNKLRLKWGIKDKEMEFSALTSPLGYDSLVLEELR